MDNTNNFKLSEHFSLQEFECPCCKRVIVNKKLVEKLEQLRERINAPLKITSGYRCPEHNRVIGGHPFSLHTQGRAVDIVLLNTDNVEMHIRNIFPAYYYNSGKRYFHCQLDLVKEW